MEILKNIAIISFFLLCVDGCMYRDPYVRLPRGYGIGASSSSLPCSLGYNQSDDDRTYSDLTALTSVDPETGEVEYSLVGPTEILDFADEAEWYEAIRKYNAPPCVSSLCIEGVTSFAADGQHIIGEYGGGFYIVDMAADRLSTYTEISTWRSAVSGSTALSSTRLVDPKSFFAQTRHPIALVVYALLFLVALGMGIRAQQQKRSDLQGADACV